MKYITALLVALVAMVGITSAVLDSNTVAANGNAQGASNSMGVNIYTGSGGYGGYPYYYDYYYYPYGGYGGYTNVNVYASQNNIVDNTQVAANVAIGGANGQDGAEGQDGANGEPADNVPAADTTEQPKAVPAPVYSGPVSANGMQILSNGPNLAEAQLELEAPIEYVFYGDYNVLVVETRGLSNDTMVKFAQAAITQEGFKAVYYVQGVIIFADGTVKNEKLDLSTPPRVARSLGYL